LEEDLGVEMNIERDFASQKFRCCDAANPRSHGFGNKRLTIRHACLICGWDSSGML
jgi:hypothetical protein